MATPSTTTILPYSFDDLKTALLANLKTYPAWSGLNPDDSILQMLVHILAYYTTYDISAINRAFVDSVPHLTASDRVQYDFANFIGLTINKPASATGQVSFSLSSPATKQVVLPVGTEISDGGSIVYSTNEFKTINAGESSVDVTVVQGQYKSTTFTASSNTWQKYYLNLDIDKSSIIVTVDGVTWSPVDTFLFATSTSNEYLIKYVKNGIYVLFGDGITGAIPANSIVISYIETKGTLGNVVAAQLNTVNSQIYYSDATIVSGLTVSNTLALSNGSDGDTSTEIKQNIQGYLSYNPYLSTKQDYIDYVKTFPSVFDCVAYAGWEKTNDPMTYSTLYIYLVKANKQLYTTAEKADVLNFIKLKDIFVTKTEINNVSYVGVNSDINVLLNNGTTQSQLVSIQSQISTIIQNHFDFTTVQSEGDTVFRDVYVSAIIEKIMVIAGVKRVNITLKSSEQIGTITTATTYTKTLAYLDYSVPELYMGSTKLGTLAGSGVTWTLNGSSGVYTGSYTSADFTASISGGSISVSTSAGFASTNVGQIFFIRNSTLDGFNLIKTATGKDTIFDYYNHSTTISVA